MKTNNTLFFLRLLTYTIGGYLTGLWIAAMAELGTAVYASQNDWANADHLYLILTTFCLAVMFCALFAMWRALAKL